MSRGAAPRREVRRVAGLELISHVPEGAARRGPPLLFVHGAFAGAWCWDDHFLPYCAQNGYAAHAVSLRGHGGSSGRDTLLLASLDDYVTDVLLAVNALDEPPVLIGHSMGGIVVQRAMRRRQIPAAVLMASVPPQGLAGSAFLLAARDPELFREIGLVQYSRPSYRALAPLRRAMFSEDLPDEEALRHLCRMQPESQRALFDLSWPQYLQIGPVNGCDVFVMGAAGDAFFPAAMVEETARIHGVAPETIPDMAHAMMLDPRWRRAADRLIAWLADRDNGA